MESKYSKVTGPGGFLSVLEQREGAADGFNTEGRQRRAVVEIKGFANELKKRPNDAVNAVYSLYLHVESLMSWLVLDAGSLRSM